MNTRDVSYLGEVWKDIKDYEDEYEVSNLGRVRNKKTKKILKPRLNNRGYLYVTLYKNGKSKNYSVHRLVYEAFFGKIPEGYEVNHISEDKTENSLSNLNLLSHKANICWGTRNERAGKAISKARINNPKICKSVIQKSLSGEIIKIWPSVREIKRELGYNHGHISNCCKGKRKTHKGYIWEYYTEKAAS